MSVNEGGWDRALRVIGGVVLMGAAYTWLEGTAAWGVGIVGAIALLTGVAGWCPAYALFGFDTCPLKNRPASRT